MNPSLTEIAYILDRSGSMSKLRQAAIDGYNEFLHRQKALPGQANLSLVLFSRDCELPETATPISEAPELNEKTYITRGFTALLDAIGGTINFLDRRLEATPEEARPGKVIVVVFTDGEENSSRKFTIEDVSESIRSHQSTRGWEFIFLGANQDAIMNAARLMMDTQNSSNVEFSFDGIWAAKRAMSRKVTSLRLRSMGIQTDDSMVPLCDLVDKEFQARTKRWRM